MLYIAMHGIVNLQTDTPLKNMQATIWFWFEVDFLSLFSLLFTLITPSLCLYLSLSPPRAVSDVLTNLKGIAGDMGGELDRQNYQLDRLNQKMDVNTVHLEQANYRIRRQL